MAGERELTKGLLAKEASFRLIVSGNIGVKEIERLIQKLEIDKDILADQDERPSDGDIADNNQRDRNGKPNERGRQLRRPGGAVSTHRARPNEVRAAERSLGFSNVTLDSSPRQLRRPRLIANQAICLLQQGSLEWSTVPNSGSDEMMELIVADLAGARRHRLNALAVSWTNQTRDIERAHSGPGFVP
jgi:hypothetical protein